MMKKVAIIVLIGLLLVGGYMGYSYVQTGKMVPPQVATEKSALPVLFLYEEKEKYNPMIGRWNEQDVFQIRDSIAYFTNQQIGFYSDKELSGEWTIDILEPQTQTSMGSRLLDIDSGKSLAQGIVYETSLSELIKASGLNAQQKYVLRIKGTVANNPIYYYQSFYYTQGDIGDWIGVVNKSAKKKFNLSKNRALMAEPVLKLLSGTASGANVNIVLTYTIATRADYEFRYDNYEARFNLKWDKSKATIETETVKEMQIESPKLTASNTWQIDGLPLTSESDQSEVKASENGRYEAIHFHSGEGISQGLNNGLYLLDNQTNQLSQLYKVDRLNSDYVWDANTEYDFKILDVSNDGDITYCVFGYMNGAVYTGYQGIGVFKWYQKYTQTVPVMMATSYMTLDQLRYLIDKQSYYIHQNGMWYFFCNDMLTGLNLKTGEVDRLESYPEGIFDIEKGIIYWQDQVGKQNEAVNILNLNKSPLSITTQTIEGRKNRVLMNLPEGLLIGDYVLSNTLEQLSGEVFYLYDQLMLLDEDGKIKWQQKSIPNNYFTNVQMATEGNAVIAQEGHLVPLIDASPEKSDLKYVQTKEETLFSVQMEEGVITTSKDNSQTIPSSSTSPSALSCIQGKMLSEDKDTIVPHDISYGTYEIYRSNTFIGEESTLLEALLHMQLLTDADQGGFTVYYKDASLVRRMIYIDKGQNDFNQIKNVPVIAQRPELPRGCEVTSTSMLLKYYGIEVDKMQLAQEVAYDLTPKTVKNGFVSFGDLNAGFVGSMSDVSLPGLGVYHQPIFDLLNSYLPDQVYDVTGLSFNQMLSLINAGHPVWVITPNSYAAIGSEQMQVWDTPSGYMEITGREHSVLVTGFDGSKVYYSDPSKAIHDQKSLKSFQAGWESIGRQCIVVIK